MAITRRSLISTAAAGLAAVTAGASGAGAPPENGSDLELFFSALDHPDAAILSLAHRAERIAAQMDAAAEHLPAEFDPEAPEAAEWGRLHRLLRPITDRIAGLNARTLDGVRAKARIAAWAVDGNPIEPLITEETFDGITDSLVWSIGRDLIAMQGQPS